MKIYELIHKRPVDESKDCFDTKQIGIYSSYEKAHAIQEKYAKELDGFRGYPQYFIIEEIEITGLVDGSTLVYEVAFEIGKEDTEEIGTIGFFPNQEEAEKAMKHYFVAHQDIPKSSVSIYRRILDKSYWVDGFFTYTY